MVTVLRRIHFVTKEVMILTGVTCDVGTKKLSTNRWAKYDDSHGQCHPKS